MSHKNAAAARAQADPQRQINEQDEFTKLDNEAAAMISDNDERHNLYDEYEYQSVGEEEAFGESVLEINKVSALP